MGGKVSGQLKSSVIVLVGVGWVFFFFQNAPLTTYFASVECQAWTFENEARRRFTEKRILGHVDVCRLINDKLVFVIDKPVFYVFNIYI